jgi:hypothetical protein
MSAGRPTLYKEEYNEQAEKLCKLGATDAELADFFDVVEDTINEWKKVHPDFSVSIKKGKMLADANVAGRLYERAMGFEHDSEEIKVVRIDKTGVEQVERVPVRKIYPPDSTAAIFWLKNRQPGKWRDRQEIINKGTVTNINHNVEMTKEEIKDISDKLEKDV